MTKEIEKSSAGKTVLKVLFIAALGGLAWKLVLRFLSGDTTAWEN